LAYRGVDPDRFLPVDISDDGEVHIRPGGGFKVLSAKKKKKTFTCQ
jgi:hypothetical protein